MPDDPTLPAAPEPDTESAEQPEEEAPTEDHEPTAAETQASELATVEVLAEEIQELRAKAAERDEFLDKLQRSKADFINYQKRVQRERERWAELTLQDFALELLPVVDDLERALDAARRDHDTHTFAHGFELIYTKLCKVLSDEGITPFDALGRPFDPAFHEAVAYLDRPDAADRTVIEVARKGYILGERVLRPAQVIVARNPRPPEEKAQETGANP